MDWTAIMLFLAVFAIFGKSSEKDGIQETKENILKKVNESIEKKTLTSQEMHEYAQILSMLKTI